MGFGTWEAKRWSALRERNTHADQEHKDTVNFPVHSPMQEVTAERGIRLLLSPIPVFADARCSGRGHLPFALLKAFMAGRACMATDIRHFELGEAALRALDAFRKVICL